MSGLSNGEIAERLLTVGREIRDEYPKHARELVLMSKQLIARRRERKKLRWRGKR